MKRNGNVKIFIIVVVVVAAVVAITCTHMCGCMHVSVWRTCAMAHTHVRGELCTVRALLLPFLGFKDQTQAF